jgi:hypothetical protein
MLHQRKHAEAAVSGGEVRMADCYWCVKKDTCNERLIACTEQEQKRKGNKSLRKFEDKIRRYGCSRFARREK